MLERILRFSIEHRVGVVLARRRARGRWRVVARAAADRRRPRHHEQPGPDQHAGAVALARRGREAGDLPDRDRARRAFRPRVHALALAQRLLAGDRGLPTTTSTSTSRASRWASGSTRRATSLPPGVEPRHGPDLDGSRRDLHVDRRVRAPARRGRRAATGAARLAARRLVPDARGRAPRERRRARGLPAHGAGLDHPPAAQGRARRRRRRRDRRLREAVPRAARPAAARRLRAHASTTCSTRSSATTSAPGAGYIEHNGEAYVGARRGPRRGRRADRARSSSASAAARRSACATSRGRHRPRAAHRAAPARTARRSSSAPR